MSGAAPALERHTSESLDIPERRVIINDPSELPSNYSQTPGGTLFSTTPGGTRIIYDRGILLQLRNSPLTKTPPVALATIPDIINEDSNITLPKKTQNPNLIPKPERMGVAKDNAYVVESAETEVFPMD